MAAVDQRWITPLGGPYALVGRNWMDRRVLRDVEGGVLQSARIVPTSGGTAVVRQQGLQQRWRSTRGGEWLVLLRPDARERYRYGAHGPGAEELVAVKPRRDVQEALTKAGARPLPDQLAGCGFERVAGGPIVPETEAGPNGELEVYAEPGQVERIAVHLVSTGQVVLVGLEPLVRWDHRRPPRPDGGGAGGVSGPSDAEPVPGPVGLGDPPVPFTGSVADLVVAHLPVTREADRPPGEQGTEGDYRWTSPSAHFHTADGTLVCGASDGRATDLANTL